LDRVRPLASFVELTGHFRHGTSSHCIIRGGPRMSRVGGLVRGTGILAIAALTLSACGGTGFDQSSATKVIQSVDVNLDPAGAITEVASNAVYLDELSGKSNSNTDDYSVEEVVEDLPVRVSTQYTTADGSGS